VEQYQRLSSSFRSVAPEDTLQRVMPMAERLGITRVTDTTRLDRIGIPVYCSIRPDAIPGSLCVSAGKGLRHIEAKVGAVMEGIEMALAEYGRSHVQSFPATPRDVFDGATRPDAILDFCPRLETRIPLDLPIDGVDAEEIFSGARAVIPAELVFLPYPQIHGGTSLFGPSSNGLASGNSLNEATLHGLAEVIERDINSFHSVRDDSRLVLPETCPPHVAEVFEKVAAAGLVLHMRYRPNPFGLPHFSAAISDPDHEDPLFVNGGTACHLSPAISAVRTVCEAVQSRLSFIHGGRDDLAERHRRYAGLTAAERLKRARNTVANYSRVKNAIAFDDITDQTPPEATIEACLERFRELLAAEGIHHVFRVVLSGPEDPVVIVKIVVPHLEAFSEVNARVGRRLRDHVKSIVT
jgi:ribosomal protein S12 methylthiotransferase accessory factor